MFWGKPEYRISSPKNFSPDIVKAISQRQDVQQAFPYLSRRRKVRLAKVDVAARNGEAHEYFTLTQGNRRFIFPTEENPTQLTDISDTQRKNRLSMTLVVPQQVMQDNGFLPEDSSSVQRFQSPRQERRFFKTMEQEGYFAMRGDTHDPYSLENNTDFIQPIPAVVVKGRQNDILFTVRGENNANHDYRLSGMITAPFAMGHSQPSDFGLWRHFLRYGLKQTMYRETAEETALQKKGETFHVFPTKNGHDYRVTLRGIFRLHHYYGLQPLGVVYAEDRDVDKVHAGVIFVAIPKRRDTTLVLNGSSREIHHVTPLSQPEYQKTLERQTVTPASWNQSITKEVFTSISKRQ